MIKVETLRLSMSPKLRSDVFWVASGNLAALIAGLAVTKIVARLVDPGMYGQAALALGVFGLLSNLLINPSINAMYRLALDYRGRHMDRWFRGQFRLILTLAGGIAFLSYLAVAIAFALTGNVIYFRLSLPMGLMIVAQLAGNERDAYIESHRQQRNVALLTLVQRVLYPVILVLLLSTPLLPAAAVVLANAVSIGSVVFVFRMPRDAAEAVSGTALDVEDLRRRAMGFIFALGPSAAASWILTSSDRYVIGYFLGAHAVGVYVVNYGLWTVPFVVLSGSLAMLIRPIIWAAAAQNDWVKVRTVLLVSSVGGFLACGLGTLLMVLLRGEITSLLLSANYRGGLGLMLTLSFGYWFFVLGSMLVLLFLAAKRPQSVLTATVVAAAANVVANIVIVPRLGILGAGVSTLGANALWWLLLLAKVRELTWESSAFQGPDCAAAVVGG